MTVSGAELKADQKAAPTEAPAPVILPRRVQLPLGGAVDVFTREQLTTIFRCTHGELGRLLCRKMAPLPIRIEGTIFWYTDETLAAQAQVVRTLERWRRH